MTSTQNHTDYATRAGQTTAGIGAFLVLLAASNTTAVKVYLQREGNANIPTVKENKKLPSKNKIRTLYLERQFLCQCHPLT